MSKRKKDDNSGDDDAESDNDRKNKNPKTQTSKKGDRKRKRGRHQPYYSDPYRHLKTENGRPKDYYDIHIKWHTVNPYAIHSISRLVYRDPMVIDCRRRIVSHLTTNNINIYDSGGNPVAIEPEYDSKFQKYYKDFVQDAYESYLIQGVVPMVLIEDESGFFFPVVLKTGTYIIQTAYSIEDERQVYRVLRPIYFCARPDRLARYEKIQRVDLLSASSFLGNDGGSQNTMASLNLEPHPSASENIIAASGIKDMGWFIDPSISVLNIFDSPPSVMGEVRSPLTGILMQHYMSSFLADTMLRSEQKMLQSVILVERTKESNIDLHSRNGVSPTVSNEFDKGAGQPPDDPSVPKQELLFTPIPNPDNMSASDRQAIRFYKEQMDKKRKDPALRNEDAVGGSVIMSYLNRIAEEDISGGVGKTRYLPPGFQFSGAYKHPEIHAGSRYFEMRSQLDTTICSSLEVPISLVKPQPKETTSAQDGQMKIFQRAIQTKARMLNVVMTTILREGLVGKPSRFERIFSVKKVTEHYENIALENNRDRERYLRSRGRGQLDLTSDIPFAKTLPEMIPPMLALPVPSQKEVAAVFKIKKPGTALQKENNDSSKKGSTQPTDDRERPPRYFFADADKQEDQPLHVRFSGTPVTPLATISNHHAREEMETLLKTTHDEYSRKMKQGGARGERDDEADSESDGESNEIDVRHLEVRLETMVFVNTVDLTETARTGAIPFTQYQRLMVQQIGVVEPPSYGGIFGARENAEFFRVIDGTEVAERSEEKKEDRNFQREKEMSKMTQKNNTDNMELQHKHQKEQTKLQASSKSPANTAKPSSSSSSASSTKKKATPAKKKKSTASSSSNTTTSTTKKKASPSSTTHEKPAKKRKLDSSKKTRPDEKTSSSSSSDSDDDKSSSLKRAEKRRKAEKKKSRDS